MSWSGRKRLLVPDFSLIEHGFQPTSALVRLDFDDFNQIFDDTNTIDTTSKSVNHVFGIESSYKAANNKLIHTPKQTVYSNIKHKWQTGYKVFISTTDAYSTFICTTGGWRPEGNSLTGNFQKTNVPNKTNINDRTHENAGRLMLSSVINIIYLLVLFYH